jgi:IclR family pca regulon transcriptional regulator
VPEDPAPRPAEHVQALERGLAVLRAFDAASPKLTMTDIARRTGMSKAAARRFLLTLVEVGYADFDGRSYSLRPRVLEIGRSYLSSLRLPDHALPHLEWLASSVRETASVTVLDGSDIVYVARVQGFRIMSVSIEIGTRLPALLTSTGRVLLSAWPQDDLQALVETTPVQRMTRHTIVSPSRLLQELERTRQRGWALTDQEMEEGLRSIAVPVRAGDGTVVAAINVSAHSSRASADDLRRDVLPLLLTAAARTEAALATDGAPPPASAGS